MVQDFCSGCKNLNNQARPSKPKTMGSEAVLQPTEANLMSSTQRISDEVDISHSNVVHHFHNLGKSIHSSQIVPHITKIFQLPWHSLMMIIQNYQILHMLEYRTKPKVEITVNGLHYLFLLTKKRQWSKLNNETFAWELSKCAFVSVLQCIWITWQQNFFSLYTGSLDQWVECSPMFWETGVQSQVVSYQGL